jgi:hypothetical protein
MLKRNPWNTKGGYGVNGNKYLLDTNILLYVTGGKLDIAALPDGEFYTSFVSELEVLSYPTITTQEEEQLRHFLSEIPIIDIPR